MKRLCFFIALAGACFGAAAASAQVWGPNLFPADPNDLGFEKMDNWTLTGTLFEQSDEFFSTVYGGSHSLKFKGNIPDSMATARYTVQTVGNRRHRLGVSIREPDSQLQARWLYFAGYGRSSWGSDGGAYPENYLSLDRGGTNFFQARSGVVKLLGSGSVSAEYVLRTYASSYTLNRRGYFDDCLCQRECVTPLVASDSVQNVLRVGEPTLVSLRTYPLDYEAVRVAFDPDITVVADNAAVGDVTWISDDELTVELTALAVGDITLTLTNPYGHMTRTYDMQGASPTACGDVGTAYLAADIAGGPQGRDCYVGLADFAVLAAQWLACTDVANPACDVVDWR